MDKIVGIAMYENNVYENIRTRAIVVHDATMLLLPPAPDDAVWHPPGGGLLENESLSDCAAREVFEETGVSVAVGGIAFTREWVVPRYCQPSNAPGHPAFALEVFFYATPTGDRTTRAEFEGFPAPLWVPLAEVPLLTLWPNELKSLAVQLAAGRAIAGIPSFVCDFDDPDDAPRDVAWALHAMAPTAAPEATVAPGTGVAPGAGARPLS
jgi:phosphatase NudJ